MTLSTISKNRSASTILLKTKRASFNYNQEDMAKLLGIKKNSYCQKENGKRDFNKDERSKIRNILKLNNSETIIAFFN